MLPGLRNPLEPLVSDNRRQARVTKLTMMDFKDTMNKIN